MTDTNGHHERTKLGMTETRDRLRRTSAALRSAKPLAAADAEFLAVAIDAALNDGMDIGEALGLSPPSPISTEALRRRKELIAALARHYPGTPSGVATSMAIDGRDYASRIWPRLRRSTCPPPDHVGKAEEILFALHRNAESGGARWPLGRRTLVDVVQSLALRLHTDPAQNLSKVTIEDT